MWPESMSRSVPVAGSVTRDASLVQSPASATAASPLPASIRTNVLAVDCAAGCAVQKRFPWFYDDNDGHNGKDFVR